MAGARILIVDDEPDIRELIADILQDEGHQVTAAADAAEAREQRRAQAPDLILLDVWMPDTDGISLLREWRDAEALDCPVVMISGHGSVETAVEATRLGAYDFIEKPVSMAKLLVTVNNALEAGRLKRENAGLKRHSPSVIEPLGRSLAVQNLRQRLERIAAHDAPVLISGETGVGKEQAARWIHAHSRRAEGPFVAAPTRIEAQGWQNLLLGSQEHPGLLAQSQGGVLFINDITLLDAVAQSLLLRILESGLLELDSSTSNELDIRIISGAGVGLADLVRSGRLDESLYYRLKDRKSV